MNLNKEEIKEVVKYRMEKANSTFAEIPVLVDNEFYRTAANRLYYACFYAASALLINDGYETHAHNGVIRLLGLHYIKGNRIDKAFGKMYKRLFDLRQTGDYEDYIDIDKDDIIPLIEPSEKFIAEIGNLINKKIILKQYETIF